VPDVAIFVRLLAPNKVVTELNSTDPNRPNAELIEMTTQILTGVDHLGRFR
jgi:hypothetical protein